MISLFLLQKGSPYLDEVNELIELARQSGLFTNINKLMPNATECATNADVQRSHMAQDVVLKLDNIYGMIVLLGLGLVGSTITFMAEKIKKTRDMHKKGLRANQQKTSTLRKK